MKKKRYLKLIPRIYLILLILSLTSFVKGALNPDDNKFKYVTVNLENVSLHEIFVELHKQTGVSFGYDEEKIKKNKKFTLKVSNVTLIEALSKLSKDTGYSYKWINDSSVVFEDKVDKIHSVSVLQGKITEPDGTPLVGVTIKIKDTNIGTVTDVHGNYYLIYSRKNKDIIVISYVGKKTIEKVVGINDVIVNIELEDDIEFLEDVVITGYGNIREVSFTGSSKRFTKNELQRVSQNNLIKALESLDPSFITIQNNEMGSNPNTLPEYYIRGRSGTAQVKDLDLALSEDISEFALTNNPSEPIFIMDGFEVSKTKVFDLDLNRVSSVTVLKDATATAFYGSRAANGVIVIETMVPQPGEIWVNYSGNLNLTVPDLRSYDLMNSEENLQVEWMAGLYTQYDEYGYGIKNYDEKLNLVRRGIDTDWKAKPLRTGVNHNHSIYLSGGTEELRWGTSFSYRNNGGVMKKSNRDTYAVDLTIDYRKNQFQIKNKFTVNTMSSRESPYGSFSQYVQMKPYLEPYNEDGSLNKQLIISYRDGVLNNYNYRVIVDNPLYEASLRSFNKTKYTDYSDNFELIWFVNDYFSTKGQFSISNKTEDTDKFTDPASGIYEGNEASLKGELITNQTKYSSWEVRLSASYIRYLLKHNINLNWVVEAKQTKSSALYSIYVGFPSGVYSSVAWASNIRLKPTYQDNIQRTMGGFLTFNYSWNDIYLFDFSFRLDGNSNFGSNKKVGNFWALGAGVNLHRYSFLQNVNWLDIFKITTTYGLTGKANFSPYQNRTSYEINFNNDYATTIGMNLKAIGNKDLKWERNKQFNVRLQTSLLKRRVNLDFEYYRNTTLDMVENMNIRSSSGFRTYTSNIGEVVNKGLNFTLELLPIQTKEWTVSVGLNGIHNKNRLIKIGDALKEYNERIDDYYSSDDEYDKTKTFLKYEEGNSLSTIYGMKSLGIDPSTGTEVYLKRDGTIAAFWSSEEQQKLGDTEPKLRGTMSLNVRWRNLSLYTAFLYTFGGDIYNSTLTQLENLVVEKYSGDRRILNDRWQKPGDNVKLKGYSQRNLSYPTSRFVQRDNSLYFTSLTVDYRLPVDWTKKLKMSSANVKFSMNDIAVLSTIKQERGTSYPYSHTFNFSINLNF